ncbi:alpha/beta fold hydrolase [Variovorax arabinosiphilus]|uniref:alpha/beta fold hydrolase n=1 Tax=Variovorax arabinosiphilus TaxID=3053498 RepID=UPI002577C944|nr:MULTISPECIES: alpha/beta fold hydrolase [unclassified Variovorax]MDM0121409.1 alpha/beta fold hydrolase [Variovorax sp. J2L1-78]MDM0130470.1 alpha/beta fold hydrolase [Variovorax sp. J2L1-63]MDM0234172.1 alpha/beta fold hydrolase [Variovorax sp. J2R1-6]
MQESRLSSTQTLSIGEFRLASGVSLPAVSVAYASYGQLAADGRNAILVTHGYTASHQMLAHGDGVAEGSWAPLIGPGKPLDTDRYFIVCSNVLGSCYGTTGPASIDPRTGAPYGPDFPDVCFADIVHVQRELLGRLGVRHLRAVVGPSLGGFQALQWALDHPGWVDAIGVVVSAPYLPPNPLMNLRSLQAELQADPSWNAGRFHAGGGMPETMKRLRRATLQAYGMDAVLAAQGMTPRERDQRMDRMAAAWAAEFDPHSLIVLLKAALGFDVRPRLEGLRADVLYVVANSDQLFPPDPAVRAALAPASRPQALRYVEMDTAFGHQASGPAHALWGHALRDLLGDR